MALIPGKAYENNEGLTYRKMMEECQLTLEQCQTAVRGLIEIDLLRLR